MQNILSNTFSNLLKRRKPKKWHTQPQTAADAMAHSNDIFQALAPFFSIQQLFTWSVFTQPQQLRNDEHRKLNNKLSLITEHHLILCGPLTGPSARVLLNAEPTGWFWPTRLHGSVCHWPTANGLQCQLRTTCATRHSKQQG